MFTRTILSLCDYSGNWSRPYKEAGYEVIQVDIALNQQDVRFLEFINRPIHGILAAPPCRVFAGSGARWQRTTEEMIEGISVVDACLRMVAIYKPVWWALENPIGKLTRYLGEPTMRFDPWWYGDPYTKRTCLWGKFNVPERNPVQPTEGSKIHLMPPSPDRPAKRSETPMGFATEFFRANP